MKVKVISLPYIFQVLYVLVYKPRYQVSVYRTIGPLVYLTDFQFIQHILRLLVY